jgi:hypothetical protein
MKTQLQTHGSLVALWGTYWQFRKCAPGVLGPETDESLKVKAAILGVTRAIEEQKTLVKSAERKTFMAMVGR